MYNPIIFFAFYQLLVKISLSIHLWPLGHHEDWTVLNCCGAYIKVVSDICQYQYNFVIIFIKKYLIGIYLPNYLVTNITLWVNSKIVHKYQIMRERPRQRDKEREGKRLEGLLVLPWTINYTDFKEKREHIKISMMFNGLKFHECIQVSNILIYSL